MYVLIVLAFILLAWGVFLFFKLRIKMMDKENGTAFHVSNQLFGMPGVLENEKLNR